MIKSYSPKPTPIAYLTAFMDRYTRKHNSKTLGGSIGFIFYLNGFSQDCSISNTNVLEVLQHIVNLGLCKVSAVIFSNGLRSRWEIYRKCIGAGSLVKGGISLDPSKISKSGWWGLQLDAWQLCNSLWYGLINSKLHINKKVFFFISHNIRRCHRPMF